MRFSQVVLESFAICVCFCFVCFASLGSHCVFLFFVYNNRLLLWSYSFLTLSRPGARGCFKRTPSWISVAGLLDGSGGGGGDGWWQLSELRFS